MKCPCDPDPMAEASGDARMVRAGVPGAACRINALPNDVLIRAISFLGARQLVQTCVLSQRWRDLWRSVPRINASWDEFNDMSGSPGTWGKRNMLFKKFFSQFLMLRNPIPLDEFNLRYAVQDCYAEIEDAWDPIDWWDAESEDANLWIGHALQCNAMNVNVSVEEVIRLHLDPRVFASKCFLTRLELTWVDLSTGFFKNLQMGCTLLECLKLYGCCICDAEISSQTMKLFTIDTECSFPDHQQASISIPSLIDLGYFSNERIPPLLTNLGSLETATVSIGTHTEDTPFGDICQFLRGLSDVTHLDFCYAGQMLEMEQNLKWCPKFNNLTTLTLGGWCLYEDFYPLIVFLQNSPNLEQLTLELSETFTKLYLDTHKKFIVELEERYFSCEHLEIVKIICPKNLEDDPVLNDLERFLIGNGISPDQIEIKNWQYL
ncbi:hypothetical protein BAE44_0023502 [Dichanthelium oligosanthes]|uniref:F-box domain-containing protein n=1 Tax=Dichanthelium oligosanthes TaxID=888268 RepID=A0A1E5URF3_9POAL|nr:hypothetical protein BAE44_0023502 [Dichanthelium oligosanthes]